MWDAPSHAQMDAPREPGGTARTRAVSAVGLAVLFCSGWGARGNLNSVWGHTFSWWAANSMACGDTRDILGRPYHFHGWMWAWNTTCANKYGTPLNEPAAAGATHVATAQFAGGCDFYHQQPELSRAPISALTSTGFLLVSLAAAHADPVLAASAAAVAAGSYAWHSTGRRSAVHLDHFGCTLFAVGVARALLASTARLTDGVLNGGACVAVFFVSAFAEPEDGSEHAAYLVAAAALCMLASSPRKKWKAFVNCVTPGAVGLLLHERAKTLGGAADCAGSLDDDLVADAVHASWHVCAVVLGIEALFAAKNDLSVLAVVTLPLLLGEGEMWTTTHVAPALLVSAAFVSEALARYETRSVGLRSDVQNEMKVAQGGGRVVLRWA